MNEQNPPSSNKNSETNSPNETNIKKIKNKKPKGPIRFEAILPFVFFVILVYGYFHFFFDHHFKKALEFGGYMAIGAEVNVETVETSFWNASLRIQNIELTNPDKPTHNTIVLGDIRFGMLWDALLRGKVVITEAAVEQVSFDVTRKHPGKVKPPEPDDNKPSALEKEAKKLGTEALEKTKETYYDNILGDLASILSGTSSSEQLKNIESSLKSKALLDSLKNELQAKQKSWNDRSKTIPQQKEIQELGDRLAKVKTKDFKTPQELQESLKQIETIVNEANAKVKIITDMGTDLERDFKKLDSDLKEVDQVIREDIKALENRFHIPSLDSKAISQSLFKRYLGSYLAKFNYYKSLIDKYLPPGLKNKNKEDVEDISIQPRTRAKGISYEFGRPNSYPSFWIKRIGVSSKANPSNPLIGNLKGEILNITSNQPLIRKATQANISGDFPGLNILGISIKAEMNHIQTPHIETLEAEVASYPVDKKVFVNSGDVDLGFSQATGASNLNLKFSNNEFQFNLNNNFSKVAYEIQAKNKEVDQLLKNIFNGIPNITLFAEGHGQLPHIALGVSSNLGDEIAKGFAAQVNAKIEEAKEKIKKTIDEAVGKERAKIETELKNLKAQYEGELKKAQDQINAKKSESEAKINQAKKDAETQAKKGLESEAKKVLGNDADKKLEELKKKFNF